MTTASEPVSAPCAAAVVLASLLSSAAAAAGEPRDDAAGDQAAATKRADEEPSPADVETARNLMDRGRDQYAAGEHAAALESFRGADALVGVTSTGLWVGKALIALGRLVEARDKLYETSRIPAEPNENPVLSDARREAEELHFELANRIPAVRITVAGLAENVVPTIAIDGDDVRPETLSLPRKLDPGDHVVRASAPGYRDLEIPFSVGEGERAEVTLSFEPAGQAGGQDAPTPGRTTISPLVWTGGGVALAGTVVGAVTGGLSLSTASEAKDLCSTATDAEGRCFDPDAESRADQSLTLAHVSTASFVVAGLGASLLVVGLLVSGEDEPTPRDARVAPVLAPGYLGLGGRF